MIFYHVYKVAGSSVRNALLPYGKKTQIYGIHAINKAICCGQGLLVRGRYQLETKLGLRKGLSMTQKIYLQRRLDTIQSWL